MQPDTFARVLPAARSGHGWALGELYRHIHPLVLRYLLGLEPGEAEDLAAEAWVGLVRSLDRFEGDEPALRALAFTIARQHLEDHRRAHAPHPSEMLDAEDRAPEPRITLRPNGSVFLETREALELVGALPSDQAEVVLLRAVGGFSVEEVASLLRLRPSTVDILQDRALRELAGSLEEAAR